jgi:hypothetical protein
MVLFELLGNPTRLNTDLKSSNESLAVLRMGWNWHPRKDEAERYAGGGKIHTHAPIFIT